jgi:hypothetical protein
MKANANVLQSYSLMSTDGLPSIRNTTCYHPLLTRVAHHSQHHAIGVCCKVICCLGKRAPRSGPLLPDRVIVRFFYETNPDNYVTGRMAWIRKRETSQLQARDVRSPTSRSSQGFPSLAGWCHHPTRSSSEQLRLPPPPLARFRSKLR